MLIHHKTKFPMNFTINIFFVKQLTNKLFVKQKFSGQSARLESEFTIEKFTGGETRNVS